MEMEGGSVRQRRGKQEGNEEDMVVVVGVIQC